MLNAVITAIVARDPVSGQFTTATPRNPARRSPAPALVNRR
jgi:hypothetical protein